MQRGERILFDQRRNHQLHRIECDHCHGSSSHRKKKTYMRVQQRKKKGMMRKWFEIAPGIIQWLAVLLFFANPPKQNPFYPKDKSAKKNKKTDSFFIKQMRKAKLLHLSLCKRANVSFILQSRLKKKIIRSRPTTWKPGSERSTPTTSSTTTPH